MKTSPDFTNPGGWTPSTAAIVFAILFGLLCLAFAGCTRVYENGKPVLVTSSDVAGLRFSTPAGTALEAATVKNSGIHQAIGNNVVKAAPGLAAAIATSGL